MKAGDSDYWTIGQTPGVNAANAFPNGTIEELMTSGQKLVHCKYLRGEEQIFKKRRATANGKISLIVKGARKIT